MKYMEEKMTPRIKCTEGIYSTKKAPLRNKHPSRRGRLLTQVNVGLLNNIFQEIQQNPDSRNYIAKLKSI